MRITFKVADEEVAEMVMEVVDKYHPDLKKAGTAITVLMVRAIGKSGKVLERHALMCRGAPAAATVRIATPGDRRHGWGDVVIRLDEHNWQEELDCLEKAALLDHELCHVGLRRDRKGDVVRVPDGRPGLKLVPHDAESGVFLSVARRHGRNAYDYFGVAHLFSMVRHEVSMGKLERLTGNPSSPDAAVPVQACFGDGPALIPLPVCGKKKEA